MSHSKSVQTFERAVPAPRRWIRPARKEDQAQLAELAAADNHAVIVPTHVFTKVAAPLPTGERREEIVGYVSFTAIPLVLPYFHTQRCKPADSMYFINQLELHMANILPPDGHRICCVPFVPSSPFAPYIERLGYANAGPALMCFKQFK